MIGKLIAVSILGLAVAGCAAKQKVAPASPRPEGLELTDASKAKLPKGVRPDGPGITLSPLYFDYDSPVLRPEAGQVLVRVAEYLKRNPALSLTVEGHCDERGTEEYNMGLGDKRAHAIRTFLVRLGIEQRRIRTVSFGKLKPAVVGPSEDAWSKNRRGEFVPAPSTVR